MKLEALAAQLGCELAGDGAIEITGVAGMEHAGPGELTFLANPKYAPKVKHTRAAAILVSEPVPAMPPSPAWFRRIPISISPAHWRCSTSRRGPQPGIHPTAVDCGHGAHRRKRLHRAVRRRRRARDHRPQCRAASARGDLRRRARSATIFLPIRMPRCANSAASAIA